MVSIVEAESDNGWAPLHSGNMYVVKYLIVQYYANVEEKGDDRNTSLNHASGNIIREYF